MMKKRMFQCFLLGLPALIYAGPNSGVSNLPGGPGSGCPAPPPTGITITVTTPTSITFAWNPAIGGAQANQLVQDVMIDGWDATDGSDIPTEHAYGVNTHTISNLKPGHYYNFDFSASYCVNGGVDAYGAKVGKDGPTGTIIVTQVIELTQPCTPNRSNPTGAGVSYTYCVASSAGPLAPYTNAFVADLVYNSSQTLHFGIATWGAEMHIGQKYALNQPLGNPYFRFSDPNAGTSDEGKVAQCFAVGNNNTLIFTAEYIESTNAPVQSKVKITFEGNYDFKYCNGACGPVEQPDPPKERSDNSSGNEENPIASSSSENMLLSLPSPNPFSQHTSFRYSLSKVSPVEITLYDPMGRLVRTAENTTAKEPGQYEVTIDGADLPDGVYYLNVMSGESKKVFALVKRG